MPFARKPQISPSSIRSVTLGAGEKQIVLGGGRTLPLYTFDAPCDNPPRVGVEISDTMLDGERSPGIRAYYANCAGVPEMAARAAQMPGASFVMLRFDSADPAAQNTSVADCVRLAQAVSAAIDVPLVLAGCKNVDKDAEIFAACAEALQSQNILALSAREENYKTVGASVGLAYGGKVGAESAVDINLAKQLNVLLTQLGVQPDRIVMNLGAASAGYGFEYVASTIDRVVSAALTQGDGSLQMPIITPVGAEAWSVKESVVSEEDMPEWGCLEERGIQMEIVTASACLVSGANAVVLRHPHSVETIAAFIDALR